jgi:DNA-binding transcriptional ArsR family regulator
MTEIFGKLQRLTILHDVCIVLIDHHRKSSGFVPSPIDDVMGATAKAAVADAALGLYRSQGKKETTLRVIGRDIEESEFALQFEPVTCCWQFLGEAGSIREDTAKGDVIRAIEEIELMGQLPTTTRIANHLDLNKGHVSRTLAKLVQDGQVRRGDRQGREIPYRLAEMLGNDGNDGNNQG